MNLIISILVNAYMFQEDWSQHIKIDRSAILSQLEQHYHKIDEKVILRLYTIKPSGTRLLVNGLCQVLHDNLTYYVYDEKKIKEEPVWAGQNAGSYFGQKDPQADGKYGELLLFVLVESVLGCKMIAHKLKSLTNVVDQIKGGDGVFLGNYEYLGESKPVYLIGESKVTASFSSALSDAFISLARFHDAGGAACFLDHELIISKEFISTADHNLDELYDRLSPKTDAFKMQDLVHPTLLMYKSASFNKEEKAAKNALDLSERIAKQLKGKEKRYLDRIADQCKKFPNVSKVYLDFFLVPVNCVDEFRDAMYQKIHHVPYKRG